MVGRVVGSVAVSSTGAGMSGSAVVGLLVPDGELVGWVLAEGSPFGID